MVDEKIMRWERVAGKYESGERLFLGKWIVGGFHWSSTRSQNDPLKLEATCRLPGIKTSLGFFLTEEEAKKKAEIAVSHWMKEATK